MAFFPNIIFPQPKQVDLAGKQKNIQLKMCKIYNQIGSLATLKSHLHSHQIFDFKSLREVMDFQRSYPALRQQILAEHKKLLEQEKDLLYKDLQQLDLTIETQKQQAEERLRNKMEEMTRQLNQLTNEEPANFFQKLTKKFRQWAYKRWLTQKEQNFEKKVAQSIGELVELRQTKSKRLEFISEQFNAALETSAHKLLLKIDRKKSVIDSVSSFIYGALGEQKVVKTLEALSDDYHLINDFAVSFSPAIYHKQENDYIKSIQIDHLLVGPSGIFLIETKNWSEKSLENLSLRSPVQQVRRTSFVLFKLLNNELSNFPLFLDSHHWGDRKISIKSFIVLTHTKPKEEFQYVKLLTLNELLGYIKYFKPTISSNDSKRIAEYLIRINEQKTIRLK